MRTIHWNLALALLMASASVAGSNNQGPPLLTAAPPRAPGAAVGPHGGRLLEAQEIALELSIFEEPGVAPRLRAYATRGGIPLPPESLTVDVTLTRLGGDIDRLSFAPEDDHLTSEGIVEEPHSFDVEVSARIEGQTHRWQYASYEGRLSLSAADATAHDVRVEAAGPRHIRVTKEVGGALVATPTPAILFNINRPDLTDVRVGQAVEIATLDGRLVGRSTVASIKPPFEDGSRATVMTVSLPTNASTWPVGTPFKGTVTLGEFDAAMAVRTVALQHFRNSKVVLAQFGDTYEVRMLEIGRQTPEWTEVKSGLKPGTRYVSQNVFVLGAKLDKNSPATVHGH
ncbi:MAG TPA: hypothetical protein VIU34_04455 [Steroidobacter sp.]